MAIIQISKIQQRSGDLVDLPQLDQAEFGFAADAKRLFIGKTLGTTENIEVLTAYSNISFSQIDGAKGNLDISNLVANGQVLAYDGNNWVNRGGSAGGLIDLGNVSNIAISGGGIGYVLTTDGAGNLSWTPKSTVVEFIKNITPTNPGVITTTEDHYFVNGAEITITGIPNYTNGMNAINGGNYWIGNLTTNSFSLYNDITLGIPVNLTAYNTYPYTTVTGTTASGNIITVVNGTNFQTNMPVVFTENIGINNDIIANSIYYVLTANSTALTISETAGGNAVVVTTNTGLSVEVYAAGGKVTSVVGGSEGSANAGGANTSVQFNYNDLIYGDSDFTYDFSTNTLTLNGNAYLGNLNVSGNITANGPIVLGDISNLSISGGTSGQVLTTYGNGTVYWGNGGGGGNTGGYYLHTQSTSNSVWTINHNLNTQYVSVNPVDSTGNSYVGRYNYPEVSYTNANSLTLTWSSALTGYCAIVGGGIQYSNGSGPGGSNTAVQFNDIGNLGGNTNFTYNKTTGVMNVGTVQTPILTTGSNVTPGTITGTWTLSAGSTLQATYADLAEFYAADQNYPKGTVLEFGGDAEVTVAGIESNKLAGVVSTEPAYVMNSNMKSDHSVMIALIGRVPVRAIGRVNKGDMMISAGDGFAKAATMTPKIGTVIGKAISNKTDDGEGTVEVMVGRM